ncbi:ribonucleoside reductase class II [Patescibacteria group bacterium]|nr:ribonucleoside reductase class II [Patescibacteria group bacterium]
MKKNKKVIRKNIRKNKPILQVAVMPRTLKKKRINGEYKNHKLNKNGRSFETRFTPRYKTIPQRPGDLPEPTFSESANKILNERYLLKGGNLKAVETVAERFWHIAFDIASGDIDFGATTKNVTELAKSFYTAMVRQEFLPNSPTIMNAGKQNGLQYSACFVLPVGDSLPEIFDTIKYAALIHQTGGGTGFAFSRLRPAGSIVNTTGGVASGPVSFLRVFNAATESIKQGGTRRGANMGILRIDHPDILEFIRCKAELDDLNKPVYEGIARLLPDDSARDCVKTLLLDKQIANFNISVALTKKFMEALAKGEDYDLVAHGSEKAVGKLNSKEVFDEIVERAWKTGDPGLIFIDRINDSPSNPVPSLETIESTNPCVTGDTLVATEEGWRRADEIKVGERISTVLGSGLVGKIEVHKSRSVYQVKFSDGAEARVTAAHQFHAIVREDRAKNSTNKKFTPLRLDQLKEGDMVRVAPALMPDKPVLDLPDGWSEKEYGFFVGVLLGDGCITENSIKRNVVKVAVNTEEKEWTGIIRNILKKAGSKFVSLDVGKGLSANLTVQNSGGAAFLVKQSYLKPAYSFEKRIPLEYQQTNREFLTGLLDGLFSTDGNVNLTSTHPFLRLKTTSKQLALDIRRILLYFGIHGRVVTIKKVADGRIGERIITAKHQQYEVIISGVSMKTFAQQIDLSHPDKKKRLRDAQLQFALTGNTWLTRIISIEPRGVEQVYDLYEPTSDTWITEGIVSRGCGEQPLAPWDACNLGSINLGKFVHQLEDGTIDVDWERLEQTAKLAVHFLDNVVQTNPYTLKQIYDEVHQNRRIGLGVMGFADMLFKLKIPYNSDEAINLAGKLMKFINEKGHEVSEDLAVTRGPFSNWAHSIYADKKSPAFRNRPKSNSYIGGRKIRNSTITTIAPTGSISIIGDCSSGIEPVFALSFIHKAKIKGDDEYRMLTIANQTFADIAKREGFWSEELAAKVLENGSVGNISDVPEEWRKVFVTAQEIEPSWHVKMQAAFQAYTDNGVSKTINLPSSATRGDVRNAYMMAYETGCNGITIYRDGSKSKQVLNVSSSLNKALSDSSKASLESEPAPVAERPMILKGRTYKVSTPVGEAFITVNRDVSDQPFEVFVTVGRAGMHTMADAEAMGRLVSLSLRLARGTKETDPKAVALKVIGQLRGIGGTSSVGFGKNRVQSLADAIAKVLAEDLAESGTQEVETIPLNLKLDPDQRPNTGTDDAVSVSVRSHADLCPECGSVTFVMEEGCKKCHSCGYSLC